MKIRYFKNGIACSKKTFGAVKMWLSYCRQRYKTEASCLAHEAKNKQCCKNNKPKK